MLDGNRQGTFADDFFRINIRAVFIQKSPDVLVIVKASVAIEQGQIRPVGMQGKSQAGRSLDQQDRSYSFIAIPYRMSSLVFSSKDGSDRKA